MARKDTVLLFVPAIIGGIIILSIFLLDIQLANFQDAYFEEVCSNPTSSGKCTGCSTATTVPIP